MYMPPTVTSLDVSDIRAVPDAVALLTEANNTHPNGHLLGSILIPSTDVALAQLTDVVLTCKRRGRGDLVHDDGRIVGVACWIQHPAHQPTSTLDPPSGLTRRLHPDAADRNVPECVDRLTLLDLAFDVPHDSTHLHLACLGTQARYGARMIADLLLYRQHQRADYEGHTPYTEAHSQTDRDWLHRIGYTECGISLGHSDGFQSQCLAVPHTPAHPDRRPPQPDCR